MTQKLPLKPNAGFFIDPVNALLILEREDLLSEHVSEHSPIRRLSLDGQKTIQTCWDSRDLDSILPRNAGNKPTLCFLARKGNNFDGHSLVETVLGSGNLFIGQEVLIRKFLTSQNRPQSWIQDILKHPWLIRVNDLERSFQLILEESARVHSEDFSSVAVTGTNGKTSVTQILSWLWSELAERPNLRMGTLGISIGIQQYENPYPTMPDLPGFLTACKLASESNCRNLVFEATSHGLAQTRMGHWKVDIAVFTNLTQDHLDFHKTMLNYRNAKGLLFRKHLKSNGTAVLNVEDQEWCYFAVEAASSNKNCIGFGSQQKASLFFNETAGKFKTAKYLTIENASVSAMGISGEWVLLDPDGKTLDSANYTCPLLGAFQHDNLGAAAGSLVAAGFRLHEIAEKSSLIPDIPGRLQSVRTTATVGDSTNQPVVIVDYAHTPDALEKTLKTLNDLLPSQGKLRAVFGCGGDRDKSKRPAMGAIAERHATVCYVTSDNPRSEDPNVILREICAGMQNPSAAKVDPDRRSTIESAIMDADENDIIVIAGKGHEDYQIIGNEKHPFSDATEAIECLNSRMRNKFTP